MLACFGTDGVSTDEAVIVLKYRTAESSLSHILAAAVTQERIMKKSIYWFSGTGNTLSLARGLAESLGGAELASMKSQRGSGLVVDDADIVVLCFPVYSFGAPRIVEEFASKLKVKDSAKVYLFASYGGMLCDSLKAFANLAAKKGLMVEGGYAVRMPGNYQVMYDVYSDDKQRKFFDAQMMRTPLVAEAMMRGERGVFQRNLGWFGWLLSHGVHSAFAKHVGETDKKFSVDPSCDGCGVCAKVCPVGNIAITGGRPEWKHSCEQCLACFHWCPKRAIQQGSSAKNGRYHHPAVTLKDMF